jgi:hypothetical protein
MEQAAKCLPAKVTEPLTLYGEGKIGYHSNESMPVKVEMTQEGPFFARAYLQDVQPIQFTTCKTVGIKSCKEQLPNTHGLTLTHPLHSLRSTPALAEVIQILVVHYKMRFKCGFIFQKETCMFMVGLRSSRCKCTSC